MKRIALVCCWGIVPGTIGPAQATLLTVTSLNDSGPGSLREAIADALYGETIDFAVTGTITLTSGELEIYKTLIIKGPGVTALKVSGNNSDRVFSVTGGPVTISDMTIANGLVGWSSPHSFGAGIANLGTLVISNCLVACNTNTTGNTGGGGICNAGGTLTIRSCIISNNYAAYGGGISSDSGSTYVFDTLIADNHTYSQGGGIANSWGSVSAVNTTICNNRSEYVGAGVYEAETDTGFCSLKHCTIVSNRARNWGGGGVWNNAPPGTNVSISSSIVAQNSTEGTGGPDCAGWINSADYNLIQNTNGATITGVTTHDLYGPVPKLGPLANYGGQTRMAVT